MPTAQEGPPAPYGGDPAGAVGGALPGPGDVHPGVAARRRLRLPRARYLVAVLLVLLVLYPVGLALAASHSLHRREALPTTGERPPQTPGTTYLVVGSDSRSDLTRDERARLGTGNAEGERTDTIMLLHKTSLNGPTILVSVPRDSYVPIPGHGRNKINAAFAIGGPQLLVRTLEQVTGLRIDDYVQTGLGGYADLVDAVGGVHVCVKQAIKDSKAHIDLKAGCQTLTGKDALGYARARYSDARGDLGRVERQRQVLGAIAGRTLSPGVLLEPWVSFPAARAGGNALTVDNGTSSLAVAEFILAMRSVSGGNGVQLTVPIGNPNATVAGAGSVVEWDRKQATALFKALAANDVDQVRPIAAKQEKK